MSGLVGMSLTYSLEVSTLAKLGCSKRNGQTFASLPTCVFVAQSIVARYSSALGGMGSNPVEAGNFFRASFLQFLRSKSSHVTCEDHFFACK